jgi:small subunit ribosomal protein S6
MWPFQSGPHAALTEPAHARARTMPTALVSRPLLSSAPVRMTLPAPTYDLVLLLDAAAEEPARAKILADAREAIAAQGELLRDDDWGDRALTYPIAHKATAKYHLLQFHAGSPELLNGLDRTLRIADEVVRFRIVKLKPGTPDAPDMRAPGASAAAVAAPAPEPVAAATEPAG